MLELVAKSSGTCKDLIGELDCLLFVTNLQKREILIFILYSKMVVRSMGHDPILLGRGCLSV